MKIVYFFIENFAKISSNEFKFIRNFYLPIIGPNSTILYEYLASLNQNDVAYKPGVNINELLKLLAIDENELILAKKRLEAVGLIRTFIKNDNKNGLISILNPLTLDKFLINDILKSNLLKKIGDIMFEKLVLEYKPRPVSKNDYIETSAKYFDIFDFSFQKDENYVTADLKLPVFDNNEDAVKSLTPNQYIQYLNVGNITFGQKEYINFARNIGLCDRSINTILNYSFECNGRIVVNFVKKITSDLYERNLIDFKGITNALNESSNARKNKNFIDKLDWGHSEIIDNPILKNDIKEVSLNELLEDLKDLM